MSNHAFLSCSGANNWINCAAYPSVSARYPDKDNSEAQRGTAAHWVLESVLKNLKNRQDADTDSFLNKEAPNGIIIDHEIIEGIWKAVNDILTLIGNNDYLWPTFEIELPVKVERVHDSQCWGTADIVIYDYVKKALYVLDFKFGHSYVEPWENWQLMLYAIGALDKAKLDDQEWQVYLNTLQPRCYSAVKAQPWVIPAYELRPFANKAKMAAHRALAENPGATTGTHCKYCKARHACDAYLKATENVLEVSTLPQLEEPTPDNLSVELQLIERGLDILKARYTALSVVAENYIKAGKDVFGYEMKPTRAVLKWIKPDSEVLALGKLLGADLKKPDALITPTQAINRGIDKEIIQRYAQRESSGMKLAQFDPLKTRKAFARK